MNRRDFLALMGLGAAGAGLAACSTPKASPTTQPPVTTTTFPIGAAKASKAKPVPVTMWHSMTSAELVALTSLTRSFNASQHDVRVTLAGQDSYAATLSEYSSALKVGSPPAIVQMDSSYLQLLTGDSGIVPVQAAIDADHFLTSDFLPASLEGFRIGDTLWGMPFNCAVQLLYYDRAAFSQAGLDPDSPPADTAGLHSAATAIVKHLADKFAMSIVIDSSSVYQWMALGGEYVTDGGNGHLGKVTEAMFGGSAGSTVFDWMSEMFKSRLAQSLPTGSFDNLLGIANGLAPMTLDSSSSLGTITEIIQRGHYTGVDLAVAPTPSILRTTATGGASATGGGLHLVAKSSPEQLDAAWQYIKYLVSPGPQAYWALETGSIPVNRSSVTQPAVERAWQRQPGYRVAYDQLVSSPGTASSAGPVTGSATQMASAIQSAMTAVASGASPSSELARAAESTNAAITSYNKSQA